MRSSKKYLTLIAFKNKLPENVVEKEGKLGCPQPLRSWISGSFVLEAWKTIKKSHFVEDFLDCKITVYDLACIKNIPTLFLDYII